MTIAFVTYRDQPSIAPDDEPLAAYLIGEGHNVQPAIWDDEQVNWRNYDVIVVRSAWDYFVKIDAFDRWLKKMLAMQCCVLNPIPVIEWNKKKSYFNEFTRMGILLPPFGYCSQRSEVNLKHVLTNSAWSRAVVKPAVSGAAHNTWVTTLASADADQPRFSAMLSAGDVIVQKFIDEVISEGELSLIFFNKKFSHAVIKKALPGEFRVQTQFGGSVTPFLPGDNLLKTASAILDTIEEPLLYARVDGLMIGNDFYLMELELIEPVLYIRTSVDACANFYKALQTSLKRLKLSMPGKHRKSSLSD